MSRKHKFSDEILDDAMRHDSIAAVEKITGKRWTEFDDADNLLALSQHARSVDAKRRILESRDDVHFGDTLTNFKRIISDIGFEHAKTWEFQHYREPCTEALEVWWLSKFGVLLQFDTYYSQTSINSGNFAYNWKMHEGTPWEVQCKCTSSSSPCGDGVIAGSHDCREAVRRNIGLLQANGEFLVPWKSSACAFLSLLHFSDYHGDAGLTAEKMCRSYELSLSRAKELPQEIQDATGLVAHFENRINKYQRSK